jgi:hypothetical protein
MKARLWGCPLLLILCTALIAVAPAAATAGATARDAAKIAPTHQAFRLLIFPHSHRE